VPARFFAPDGDLDSAPRGCALDRVGEQVEHDLLEPVGIVYHRDARRFADELQPHIFVECFRSGLLEGYVDDRRQVDEFEAQVDAAGV
jgi:hypothetical protein